MTNKELKKEIIKTRCWCNLCNELKQKVIENGIDYLKTYEGFQCPTVMNWLMEYNRDE